jgi:hypothetical protein
MPLRAAQTVLFGQNLWLVPAPVWLWQRILHGLRLWDNLPADFYLDIPVDHLRDGLVPFFFLKQLSEAL